MIVQLSEMNLTVEELKQQNGLIGSKKDSMSSAKIQATLKLFSPDLIALSFFEYVRDVPVLQVKRL